MAAVWPTLTRNQQAEFALAQAGANQTQNFTALMNNFQVAIDATATAMDSAGSAMKENTSYIESLEAQTTQLKATFQDFANNVIDKELVSSILTLANDALGALNTEGGKTITQWVLLTGVLTGGLTIYGQIASKLIGAAKSGLTFASAITGAGTAASGAAVGLGTLATTALPIAAILAGVAIAGWEVYKWYKETHKPLQEYTDEIQANTQQLETNRDRLAEIEQMSWDKKTPEILDEYDALVQQNEELQRNIDLLEERRRNQAVRQARSGGQVQQSSTYSFDGLSWSTDSEEEAWNTLALTLGMAGASIDEVKEKAKELGYTLQENAVMVKVDADAYNEDLTASMQEYADQLNSTHSLNQDQLKDFNQLKATVSERVEGLKLLEAQGVTLTESERNLIDVYDSLIETEAEAKDWTEKYGDALIITDEQAQQMIKTFPALKNQLIDTGSGWTILNNSAQAAANGLISADGRIKKSSQDRTKAVLEDLNATITYYGLIARAFATMGTASGYTATQATQANELARSFDATRKQLQAAIARGVYDDTGSGNTPPGAPPSTKKDKDKDLALKEFKNLQKDLEHQKELGLIKEEEYYNKLEQLIKDYKAKATAHMKEYGTDVDTINRNMYQYEEEIYKGRAKLADDLAEQQKKATEDALEAAEKAAQAQKEQIEEQKRLAEEREQAFLDMIGYLVSEIDEDIDALNKQLDEIDQRYDDEIAKLEAQNDLIESQVELEEKLNNLAKARSQKLLVYKDGRFQYVSDADAVSAATVELEQYNRKKLLEMQRQDIEDRRAAERADIEATIKSLEDKKEAYNKFLDDYQDYKTALNIEQKLGIKLEKDNFNTSLNNLQNYKDEYVAVLGSLVSEQKNQLEQLVTDQKSQLEQLITDQKAKLEDLKLTRDQFNALLKAGYNVNGVYLDPNKDTVFAGAQEEVLGGPISDPNYYNPRADYDAAIQEVLTSAQLGGYEPWQELLDSLYRQKANQDEARKQGLISGYGSSTVIYGGIGWDSSDNEDYTNWGNSGFNNHYHDDDDDDYDDRYQMHTGSTVYQDAYDKYISEGDYESAKEVIEEAEARGQTVNKHASGTLGSAGGLSLVGEKGPELRVLNSGDGIIPADATRNLWDWAKFSPKEFNGGTMIHIANLNLPNVRDGNDFVKYMVNNFWRETVQYAST